MHDGHQHNHIGEWDEIEITIMPDGSVKAETFGDVGEANHMGAERVLNFLADKFGGSGERIRKSPSHQEIKHKHSLKV